MIGNSVRAKDLSFSSEIPKSLFVLFFVSFSSCPLLVVFNNYVCFLIPLNLLLLRHPLQWVILFNFRLTISFSHHYYFTTVFLLGRCLPITLDLRKALYFLPTVKIRNITNICFESYL